MSAVSIGIPGEKLTAGNTEFPLTCISNGLKFWYGLNDILQIFYFYHKIQDRLGFDPGYRSAADMVNADNWK